MRAGRHWSTGLAPHLGPRDDAIVAGSGLPRASRLRTLVTARLDLLPCTQADAPALWEIWTDPDVRRYLWDDEVIPVERARAIVADSVAEARTSGLGLRTVRRRGAETIVGFCGLLPNHAGEVELLYGLAPACWGQGLATEAARAVLRDAFEVLGLARVVAATDPPNHASIRVLERLGMAPRTEPPAAAGHLLHFQLCRPPEAPLLSDGGPAPRG
jgi:ribosomal-protein-alanine N-acetyltransferase